MIWNSTSRLLHPPGREGKKRQANKEFGKQIQKNSGVAGRPLRDGQCRHQEGLSLPSLGFTLYAQSCTPTSADNPHPSTPKIIHFSFWKHRSGSPHACQELSDNNATREAQIKSAHARAVGSSSAITCSIHSLLVKVLLCQ